MFQKSAVIVYSMTVCFKVLWTKFKPVVVVCAQGFDPLFNLNTGQPFELSKTSYC